MNRWRRSVDEVQARKRQLSECQRAQQALSEVTSCFQQLASSLGNTSDGSFLREELNQTRIQAHRICTGLSRRLLCLLSDSDPASSCEDRDTAQRLWVHFLSALENFLSDLHKASDLIGQFPLTQRYDRHSLVNTGSGDSVVGVASRAAVVQTPWLSLDEEQLPDLTKHIVGLEDLLSDMQMKVSVPVWAVEATQQAWAESHTLQDSLEDLMEVEVVSHGNKKIAFCCHPPCCPLAVGCVHCTGQ